MGVMLITVLFVPLCLKYARFVHKGIKFSSCLIVGKMWLLVNVLKFNKPKVHMLTS